VKPAPTEASVRRTDTLIMSGKDWRAPCMAEALTSAGRGGADTVEGFAASREVVTSWEVAVADTVKVPEHRVAPPKSQPAV